MMHARRSSHDHRDNIIRGLPSLKQLDGVAVVRSDADTNDAEHDDDDDDDDDDDGGQGETAHVTPHNIDAILSAVARMELASTSRASSAGSAR